MFIGKISCPGCHFATEEFLIAHHHFRDGFSVAVQDRRTLGIRLIHIPDDDLFYCSGSTDEKVRQTEQDRYVKRILAAATTPDESPLPAWDMLCEKDVAVPCPRCGRNLIWENTGIT